MAGNDAYTVSLLHFDGNYTDSAAGGDGHTWTAVGSVVATGAAKFGTASLAVTASASGANELNTPYKADYALGSGNFTIDMWVKVGGTSTYGELFSSSDVTSHAGCLIYGNAKTNKYGFALSNNGSSYAYTSYNLATIPNDGAFHHIALDRYGNLFTFFLDGVAQGSTTVTGALYNPASGNITVGGTSGVYESPGVNIDELRVSVGISRYSGANFTPPTAPYSTASAATTRSFGCVFG